jgi:hypothetical protein
MRITCATLSLFLFLLSASLFAQGHVFRDEFTEDITTDEIIPLPSKLPSYWQSYMDDLKAGFQRENELYEVSREAIVDCFDTLESSISKIHLHLPMIRLCRADPIIFYVVHGTWSDGNPEYFDQSCEEFQATIEFVRELAERYAQPVEIVSFRWSGEDSIEARQEGGDRLRKLTDRHYQTNNGYSVVWAYCHSHGGNIVNIASQDVAFDTCIYCATPVVEGTLRMYRPLYIKRLYHMYATSDPIQQAGSFDRRSLSTFFAHRGNGRVYQAQEDKRILNMRLQCDGKGPGHMAVKNAMRRMWKIMDITEDNYYFHNHLDVNIASDLHGLNAHEPMISIRGSLMIDDILARVHGGEDGAVILKQLRCEIAYSQEQESLFRTRYRGRSIHDENTVLHLFTTNWQDFVDLCHHHAPWLQRGTCLEYSLLDPVTPF